MEINNYFVICAAQQLSTIKIKLEIWGKEYENRWI